MPRTSRLSWITSASLALPAAERCDRPRSAALRISGDHPGRLAQGPDEKCGRPGRNAGLFMVASLPERRAPVGERGPRSLSHEEGAAVNVEAKPSVRRLDTAGVPTLDAGD